MKTIAVNPYLPGWEYVPDGEPHVFGERIYIFGSHDKALGNVYSEQDYTVWSAPVDDLGNWTCHGVTYQKEQDPHYNIHHKELWAPDVCQGKDGKFYLYYCCAFIPEIGIAVADRPEGPYEFYDYVRDEEGKIWDKNLPFDPSVLFEDEEHIWLYSGFGMKPIPEEVPNTLEFMRQQNGFEDAPDEYLMSLIQQMEVLKHTSICCDCLRLASDMKTVIAHSEIAPVESNAAGTSFEGHAYYEASSIRRIHDKYYLVYSAQNGNQLCYATSRYPDKDFVYRGVIVSNADLEYKGNTVPKAYYANNHGGLAEIQGKWYIFYHRHTNNTQFSRQGCAERVEIMSDGSIPQVEITSSGLNGKSIPANHAYSAHICCNIIGAQGACLIDSQGGQIDAPYITEEKTGTKDVNEYIHNLKVSDICGIKYLNFDGENVVNLILRGQGTIALIMDDPCNKPCACISMNNETWCNYSSSMEMVKGIHAVYFKVLQTDAYIDFSEVEFSYSK